MKENLLLGGFALCMMGVLWGIPVLWKIGKSAEKMETEKAYLRPVLLLPPVILCIVGCGLLLASIFIKTSNI